MIEVGSFRAQSHAGISRRAFVQAAFAVPFLSTANAARAVAAAEAPASGAAKSVILLWLWGGPSHVDTFDPKPAAPVEIRGPFSTIATRTTGVRFTELFPGLAARSHLFSLVRSNRNLSNEHCLAGSIALTGAPGDNGDDGYGPNMGSVVQRLHAGRNDLPPFVAVTQGRLGSALGVMKGYGGGKWGQAYDPFDVTCRDTSEVELPALRLLDGLGTDRLNDRQELLGHLDRVERLAEHASYAGWNLNFRRAYRLLTSPEGKRAFDLSRESAQTQGAYGRTIFGQSCLLARRLVEANVPYIQVNWSKWVESIFGAQTDFGWDTHRLNFEFLADHHGPILDRAVSALLDDLDQRGLLKSTLVVALGEFGRTPKISKDGGRDHWPQCYCSLWAGAGIQPGRVVGASDERGYEPTTAAINPDSVAATILRQTGVTTERLAELRLLPNSHVIEDLL
ncbi:MAG: DUF1501 domain-containing protein [Planctomycetaceae bacterium]